MSNKGKSVCIFSPKGGVGKTTLAINLAGVSANLGYKTLLLDYDTSNGCLSMLLNDGYDSSLFNLTEDLYNNRFKNINDYIYKYNDMIDILPSPKDPRQGTKIPSKYLGMIIERLKNIYDLILIDTSSKMDEINIISMDACDKILFVVNNDLFTLKNAKNMISIFNDCNIDKYKVLLNSCIDVKSSYFSLNDIKKIIGTNVDYAISKNMFIKDLTSYYYNYKIPTLNNSFNKKNKNDIKTLELIIENIKEANDEK